MSDTDGKSMDDVLASIRRIVRTEEQDADAAASAPSAEDSAQDKHPHMESAAEEPLVLTPEMRTDVGADVDAAPTGGLPSGPAKASDGSAEAAPGLADREALRASVREILREELGDGPVADAVRGIIRDELTNGEIGGNISQNVVRLIREEVARALEAR